MATANALVTNQAEAEESAEEEVASKAAHKRFESLTMVRNKAIKGKGAWYWAHLEPVLVPGSEAAIPKAVKLRCSLCDTVFSASNPSRTASEHLKRGTCPNFASPSSSAALPLASPPPPPPPPKPISAIAPCDSSSTAGPNCRKRSSPSGAASHSPAHLHLPRFAAVDPARFSLSPATPAAGSSGEVLFSTPPPLPLLLPPPLPVFSSGKEDLGSLGMLEGSVKRLKSPKSFSAPSLSKPQMDSALSLLSDWFHESAGTGAISLSSAEHPKFRAFLGNVGLPLVSRRDLVGHRLEGRYEEARAEADARIHDALFFQLSSDGWKKPQDSSSSIINMTVNLPNGTIVFHRSLVTHGRAASKSAEEVLLDTITDIAGEGNTQRCAGIIADKFKSKALLELENQYPWMVNLSCQLQGLRGLIKDIARELPLVHTVAAKCYKLASFFNKHPQVRSIFHKYQLQELDNVCLLRVPPSYDAAEGVAPALSVFPMIEDILSSARAVQSVVLHESYKSICRDDPTARDMADMVLEMSFWNQLESVHALVRLLEDMVLETEAERPLVGQSLPLWEELRSKVSDWSSKYNIKLAPLEKVIDKRFKKHYHPAWPAAFVLDPLYLVKDVSGKYLPPFKSLSSHQEKDVDKLITRLVSRDEAHIALMELMKWRTEGLDPLYAQAVQVRQRDPATGKLKVANPQSSRLVWETYLNEFKCLGKVAVRLIFLHATSCGFKHNPSLLRRACCNSRLAAGVDRMHKLIFVAANAKLERRDFSSEEEKDSALFINGEDEEEEEEDDNDNDLNESTFAEASTVRNRLEEETYGTKGGNC
ncbi:uncharacterized protein LOC121995993 isoform X2 [Zingiber officinale]|uniref:uncharacterized protein LOC121995993 isoform X2 n=1 Tax=Zingiber officinale TaxID=94328 RepID=UPI001C4BB7A5|nr:uncharacterized protein LOC121995993 isoform X2 [Zingiber officinale]